MKIYKKIMALVLTFVFVLSIGNSAQAAAPMLYVYYFNTGQSDCMLITFDGKAVLVDSGYDARGNTVVPGAAAAKQANVKSFLTAKGITELEYLIITHCDPDHYKGITQLVSGINIKKIVTREYDATSLTALQQYSNTTYVNYVNVVNFIAAQSNITSTITKSSTPSQIVNFTRTLRSTSSKWLFPFASSSNNPLIYTITATNSTHTIQLAFLNREASFINGETSISQHVNNDSLTFSLNYSNVKYLFTGDVVWAGRNQLVTVAKKANYKFDVLKASHHGQSNNNLYGDKPSAYGFGSVLKDNAITVITNDPATQTTILELNKTSVGWPTPLYITGTISSHISAADKSNNGITSYSNSDYLGIRISTGGANLYPFAAYKNKSTNSYATAPITVDAPRVN